MSVEMPGRRGARTAAGALLFLLAAVSAPLPVTPPPAAPTCHGDCDGYQSHFEATDPTNPSA